MENKQMESDFRFSKSDMKSNREELGLCLTKIEKYAIMDWRA